jgi:hypothetical protein
MNTRPTESEGFSRTYLIKGKTTTGYIYTPIALIGKRVRLQEVKIVDTGLWICPFCSAMLKVRQRDSHILKYHPKEVAE